MRPAAVCSGQSDRCNTGIVNNGSNITLNGCNFRQQGSSAIYGNGAAEFTMIGGSISGALNNGIDFPIGASKTTIDGVTVSDSGVIPGAGLSGDGGYCGIFVVGSGTIIRNCVVINSGYNAVHFIGNDVLVEEKQIARFCIVKDDGAGVYTYLGDNAPASGVIIRNNVVLDAIGAYAGSESFSYEAFGKAAGIYLDGYVNHALVDGNVVAHGEWGGIFLNGNSHNRISNNLVYDFASQLLINAHTATGLLRGSTVTNNRFIGRSAAQRTIEVNLYVDDDIALFGTFNDNVYARPVSEGTTIVINRAYPGGKGASSVDLATWKSTYGLDANSKSSAVSAGSAEALRFEYATGEAAAIALEGTWKDVSGVVYSGHLRLDKYSGKVLIGSDVTASGGNPEAEGN